MGLNIEAKAAFAEAGGVLAQLGGMDASAEGNAQIEGSVYTGVFGPPQIDRQMLPSGGYRQRGFLQWTALRSAFTDVPQVNKNLVRIDLAEHITYRIERVNTHDPIHYSLMLIRVGE